jgi:uncharacterized membrane protein YoaK (UPF0700 family)
MLLTPSRVELLAAVLFAATGGFGDAASFFLVHCFTGHITGNSVLVAVGLATHQEHAWQPLLAVTCFLLATGLAEVARFTAGEGLGGRRFRWVLLIEMLLLGSGPWLLKLHPAFLIAGMCFALGLQNGTLTKAEGISLHTTYLSGTLTHLVGSLLRPDTQGGAREERRLLLLVGLGFLMGAIAGSVLITRIGPKGLWGILVFPAGVFALSLLIGTGRPVAKA